MWYRAGSDLENILGAFYDSNAFNASGWMPNNSELSFIFFLYSSFPSTKDLFCFKWLYFLIKKLFRFLAASFSFLIILLISSIFVTSFIAVFWYQGENLSKKYHRETFSFANSGNYLAFLLYPTKINSSATLMRYSDWL